VLLDVSAVPPRPVGAGVYTVELARGLDRRADVDLVVLARRDDEDRWRATTPDAVIAAMVPSGRPARLAWEQARGPGLVKRFDLDVWHGPHYTLPLRIRIPSVVTVHDLTFFDHPEWHERSKVIYFRRMIAAAARRATACVSVSEHTARRLRAVCSPAGPVHVVPHGVDHDRFFPTPTGAATGTGEEERDALARRGIAAPYVAFIGTLEPRKDVPTLVRAFARVVGSRPELRLVLAGGDGWGVDAVRDAIESSGAATRVLRTGYLPHDLMAPLLRQATAVAYPSLEEGFGLPALEALACGAPLVTTTGSAVAEVVADAAVLVPPGDVDALTAGLEDALDPARAETLRAAGPRRAAGFTWAASIEAHVAVYREALVRSAVLARPPAPSEV